MDEIVEIFYSNRENEKALQMSAYMRNQFPFLGIGSKKRAELSHPYLSKLNKSQTVNWKFVFDCFEKPEREFTYLALSYLDKLKVNISITEFSNFETIIAIKPWWDSIDSIAPIVGFICKKYPELVDAYIRKWSDSNNIWLIRISIILQLKYKENTNIQLLSNVILKNNKSKEFFIDKAIGWALRQYARTNPFWVSEFVRNNYLSPLSKREALKWIN